MSKFLTDTLAKMSQNIFEYSFVSEHSNNFFILRKKKLHFLAADADAKIANEHLSIIIYLDVLYKMYYICIMHVYIRILSIYYQESLKHVQNKRFCVQPSPVLEVQLKEFEPVCQVTQALPFTFAVQFVYSLLQSLKFNSRSSNPSVR